MAALIDASEVVRLAERGLGIKQDPQERTASRYYQGSVIQLPNEYLAGALSWSVQIPSAPRCPSD